VSRRRNAILIAMIGGGAICAAPAVSAQKDPAGRTDPWTVDFHYAPPGWQTAICLPDDWQKTLVAKDGGLLYDYGGKYAGFKTKITVGGAGRIEWVGQTLHSPRVPIVRTVQRLGQIELVAEAFAALPTPGASKTQPARPILIERAGDNTGLRGWAAPTVECDPAFRNIAVGWAEPVRYGFRAEKDARYTVVFGLCEGHHTATGQRVLDLQIEGKTRKTVDMVAAKGRNVPGVFALEARDQNGDGWIELAVSAAKGSSDVNTVLNVLWVFPKGSAPRATELIAGKAAKATAARVDCGGESEPTGPPRHDVLILRLVNTGKVETVLVPSLTIESEFAITPDRAKRRVRIGAHTTLTSSHPIDPIERAKGGWMLLVRQVTVAPGKERAVAFCVARGTAADVKPIKLSEAQDLRARAEQYWQQNVSLPHGRITVPDPGIQGLLDSSIRNIYQAREIKKGLPAFQVGPTCYRGLWVVDGSFLMEAVTFLGRLDEARNGIKYLLGFQRDDGGVMIIDGHWKETGITLWAVTRHARLTGDKAWLNEVWPKVERAFAHIRKMRQAASAKPDAPNAGLIPDGFSDGGLAGRTPEYTNVYWTMAGMRAAVEAARWLGKTEQARDWQNEYVDFCRTFRRAAERDMRTDRHGNRYLPIRMATSERVAPQKAQWAFLHAVFPGKVFARNDPLVRGNLAMLQAVEREGLVYGTGWLSAGIWNYFGSFYAHAWLWQGQGQKAARILYAFANHASPLLAWREEQMPVGRGERICGDMPHNWASAEFIRLVRHLLVLERGDTLHLFEGMPARWARPKAVTKLKDVVTEFGPVSLELRVAADGKTAHLHLDPPQRTRPARIVLHLDGWSGRTGTIDLPATGPSDEQIKLMRSASR